MKLGQSYIVEKGSAGKLNERASLKDEVAVWLNERAHLAISHEQFLDERALYKDGWNPKGLGRRSPKRNGRNEGQRIDWGSQKIHPFSEAGTPTDFCTGARESFVYLCGRSCGIDLHLIEAKIFWQPAYDLKLYPELTFGFVSSQTFEVKFR
ncbi:MAG: hypothetical protein U0176_25815 [Bacteroidia bacterium]